MHGSKCCSYVSMRTFSEAPPTVSWGATKAVEAWNIERAMMQNSAGRPNGFNFVHSDET